MLPELLGAMLMTTAWLQKTAVDVWAPQRSREVLRDAVDDFVPESQELGHEGAARWARMTMRTRAEGATSRKEMTNDDGYLWVRHAGRRDGLRWTRAGKTPSLYC